jgi:energy-coupling factor transport system ATP-binding protein
MEIIRAEGLSFSYPDEERPALSEVSFRIEEGEFVVLCGASGCGKTTLLRHLKPELAPVGIRTGSLLFGERQLSELSAKEAAKDIGMVFQNPDNGIVMDQVWHELAFGMENLGYQPQLMRARLAEIAQFFDLEPLLYKPVHMLSGGQKQLLNLASVLLLQPKLLLLDESTSQLDPVAAKEFISMVQRLNQEFSMTVVMSEHRLEDVIPAADRLLLLEDGKLKYSGSPRSVIMDMARNKQAAVPQTDELHTQVNDLAYLPSVTQMYLALNKDDRATTEDAVPLTILEGRHWLQSSPFNPLRSVKEPIAVNGSTSSQGFLAKPTAVVQLECHEVTFQYEKNAPEVLKKLNLRIAAGEMLAILGGNGAGKSTLLQVMAGLLKPRRGGVRLHSKVKTGYLAQNPLLYFSHDTVEEELAAAAEYAGLPQPRKEIDRLLDLLELAGVKNRHPHDISGGQQQKAALAIVMLLQPDVLLLDEPTKGLDPIAKRRLAELLQSLNQGGHTIVMVTHDVEFAAQYASRCAMLFDGIITAEGPPEAFFASQYFYTTSVNRLVRDWLPDVVTLEEVLRRWNDPAGG